MVTFSLEEDGMPIETVIVLAVVGLYFAIFMIGLAYADFKTREFRG